MQIQGKPTPRGNKPSGTQKNTNKQPSANPSGSASLKNSPQSPNPAGTQVGPTNQNPSPVNKSSGQKQSQIPLVRMYGDLKKGLGETKNFLDSGKLLDNFKSRSPGATANKPRQQEKSDGEQPQASKMSQVQNIADTLKSAKGDPRKMVGKLADKYLGLGEKIGTLLWIIWGILAILGALAGLIIGGLPVILIFNLLLVKPKWVYQLTLLILDLIGVGEALQIAGRFGLDQVDIRLKSWQKASIVIFDVILIFIIIFIIYVIISVACAPFGGTVSTAAAAVADFVTGNNVFGVLNSFCAEINKINGDIFKNVISSMISSSILPK